jgi:hypothetical protein
MKGTIAYSATECYHISPRIWYNTIGIYAQRPLAQPSLSIIPTLSPICDYIPNIQQKYICAQDRLCMISQWQTRLQDVWTIRPLRNKDEQAGSQYCPKSQDQAGKTDAQDILEVEGKTTC